MPSFSISKAAPIPFKISTEVGAINAGATILDNYLYSELDVCGRTRVEWNQVYTCEDLITLQIEYDNGTIPPLLNIKDSIGTVIDTILYDYNSGDTYEFTIDWSSYDCDACYSICVISYELTINKYGCGDSGTFETGTPASWNITTGPNNTQAVGAVAHSGAQSYQLGSDPSAPTAADSNLATCGASAISADTLYLALAWVRDNSTNPFTPTDENVQFALKSYTDAIEVVNNPVTITAGNRNQWQLISMIFRTRTDITGSISIENTLAPEKNGIMYIDDIELYPLNEIEEACTDLISVREEFRNDFLITYYNDNNGHGQDYTNNLRNKVRVLGEFFEDSYPSERELYVDSVRGYRKTVGKTGLTRTLRLDAAPTIFHRIISLALDHQHFLVDGLEWFSDSEYLITLLEETTLFNSEIDLIVNDYDYQTFLCG